MASSAPAGAIAWRREEERRPSAPGLPLFVPCESLVGAVEDARMRPGSGCGVFRKPMTLCDGVCAPTARKPRRR
jgi:hypothetical protein